MSKPIKLPETAEQKALQTELDAAKAEQAKAEERVRSLQKQLGEMTKELTEEYKNKKATLLFSESAWLAMLMLVRDNSKEVAWHGVTSRIDDEEDGVIYRVDRILVYPQKVTAGTVTFDQEKYQPWLDTLDDDTFNNLRSQFHSHVNMGVTPSSTDTEMQRDTLDQIPEDEYYIFGIWNKKDAHWCRIVDFRDNVVYETGDVSVEYEYEDGSVLGTVIQAREIVEEHTYTSTTNKNQKNNVVHLPSGSSASSGNTATGGKPSDEPLDKSKNGTADSNKNTGGQSKNVNGGAIGTSAAKGTPVAYQFDDDYDWPTSEYDDRLYGYGFGDYV